MGKGRDLSGRNMGRSRLISKPIIEEAVWPGTGYRSVKLLGFRLLQSVAVSGPCVAGTNGLRCLSLVRSEMQEVRGCRRECGQVGPSWCVELKTLLCPRGAGEQSAEAAAKLPLGNEIRGNANLMGDCDEGERQDRGGN